jgi:adenylate cyclase
MMSSLGRLIVDYLREVVETGAVTELVLYDVVGREYFSSVAKPVSPGVKHALDTPEMPPVITGEGRSERVMMARRLDNEAKCTTCHGDDHPVRGVVTVSLPNDKALVVREDAIARTSLFSGVALLAILALLFLFLSRLVDRPVREIGAVAERVGQGDLTVRVAHADPDGDEMRRLGTRINAMIHELRTKFVLEKYVSRGAAAAASADAARSRMDLRAVGERRHLTILFSDIRGFTAFSETVPPETVVGMLNRFLQAQASVVEKWQGDIDKYVGDELMAVFAGPDAARRAVRCAVEMLEAVEACKQPDQNLAVGVGISAGDVVYGPIGSEKRLDFTVIGDVVNTGARLCSAAAGGQVLCSRTVIEDCRGGLGDIEFDQLAPLAVKNKREPLEVYAARRVDPG